MQRWHSWVSGLALTAFFVLLPAIHVAADMVAPMATFDFKFQGSAITIVSAKLILCSDAICTSDLANDRTPVYAGCSTYCVFTEYDQSPYRKLIVTFSDRTRESAVFQQTRSYAFYLVTVSDTALSVAEDYTGESNFDAAVTRKNSLLLAPFNSIMETLQVFLVALVATIFIDVVAAAIYLFAFKLPRVLLIWVAIAPVITLPFVWFVFLPLPLPSNLGLLLGEGFVVFFETAFLYWRGRKVLPLRHAFTMSLVVNVISFGLGLLLLLG